MDERHLADAMARLRDLPEEPVPAAQLVHSARTLAAADTRRTRRQRFAAGSLAVLATLGALVIAQPLLSPPGRTTIAVSPTTAPDQPLATTAARAPEPSALSSADPIPTAAERNPTVGTTWTMESLNDTRLEGTTLDRRPWLRLAPDGTVNGHDGCTAFKGRYQLIGDNITFSDLSKTAKPCPVGRSGQDLFTALQQITNFKRTVTRISLRTTGGHDIIQGHQVAPTSGPVPAHVLIRVTNDTPQTMTQIRLLLPDYTLTIGQLRPGQTSEYLTATKSIYSYSGLDIAFADGTRLHQIPADYVGELPLANGSYTYVLSPAPNGSATPGTRNVGVGLEETGQISGS